MIKNTLRYAQGIPYLIQFQIAFFDPSQFPAGNADDPGLISIVLLWDFAWVQTLYTILLYQPKHRLKIY